MQCPQCNRSNIRRSPRRGLYEGLLLRIAHKAPYRCRTCGFRFVAPNDPALAPAQAQARTTLGYLGLGRTDNLELFVGIGVVILLLMLLAFGLGIGLFDETHHVTSTLPR